MQTKDCRGRGRGRERESMSKGERARKGPPVSIYSFCCFSCFSPLPFTHILRLRVCIFFIRFFSSIRFNSNGICNSIFYCYILVVVVLCRRRPPQRSRRRRRRRRRRRTRSRIDCRI